MIENAKEIIPGRPMNAIPIEIALRSGFENAVDFMDGLASLRNGVLGIEHFEMASSQADGELISVRLFSHLYVKRSADEQIFHSELKPKMQISSVRSSSRFKDYGRNVFSKSKQERSLFNVQGIIFDPKNPLVLINGELKHTGEEINGFRVVNIFQDMVVLEGNGKRREFRIKTELP